MATIGIVTVSTQLTQLQTRIPVHAYTITAKETLFNTLSTDNSIPHVSNINRRFPLRYILYDSVYNLCIIVLTLGNIYRSIVLYRPYTTHHRV